MKTLFILLSFVTVMFGANINESLLKVHATLVPKISLMDYQFKNKLKNNTISIAIMYKNSEYKDALSLKNKIDSRYKNGIKSYSVKSEIVPYSNIKSTKTNIYYLFPARATDIKRAIEQAKTNNALTFSYLEDDLRYGVMISLNVSKKIKPILNLTAIKTNNITFRPVLINISNIYTQGSTLLIDDLKKRGFNDYHFIIVV